MIVRKVTIIAVLTATVTVASYTGFWVASEVRAREARRLYTSGYREAFAATYQSHSDKEVTLEFTRDHWAILRRGTQIMQRGTYSVRRDFIIQGGWIPNERFYYRIDGPELHTGDTGVIEDYTMIR